MSLRSHVTMALFSVALGLTCSAQAAPLTAGSPPSSAPTTFLDTKTGKIEGFMPDVARKWPNVRSLTSTLPRCLSRR